MEPGIRGIGKVWPEREGELFRGEISFSPWEESVV